MAHDGTGTGWTITDPQDTELRSLGAKEIRDLRIGMAIRIDKEHQPLSASSGGGEHKEGSAVVYNDIASTFPTNKPDGATALDANDDGRLAVVDGQMYIYDGVNTQWVTLARGNFTVSGDNVYTSFVDVKYPFRTMLIYHSGGHNAIVLFGKLVDETILVEFINSDSTVRTIQINSDQSGGDFRFRVRSNTTDGANGTYRYSILL